ncbi:hypothetical protein Tco_0226913 [Tanacetum coccineum]
MDSHSHLFFKRDFSKEFWCIVARKIDVDGRDVDWNTNVSRLANRFNGNSIGSIIRRLCIATSVYLLWQERNCKIFKDEKRSIDDLCREFNETVKLKAYGVRPQNTVMLDSEASTITYTAVSSLFADLPDIGSSGVDGPPVMPDDPYAYVPVYPEFMPQEDEVLPDEEQPLPAAISPTADSPDYVPESDPEEDPEEDDNEDHEEDHADSLADGGDDGDDEDESSDDEEDDDVDIEEGKEEEEEHPAPTHSTIVALPAVDHAPSTEETKPFETDESTATPPLHPAYRVTARISIRDKPPTPFWSDMEVARLLAIPTPPPSPLSPWSSPLPQIPSPPLPSILSLLPLSPPLPISSPSLPASTIYPLGYQAAMIWLRAETPSTSHS